MKHTARNLADLSNSFHLTIRYRLTNGKLRLAAQLLRSVLVLAVLIFLALAVVDQIKYAPSEINALRTLVWLPPGSEVYVFWSFTALEATAGAALLFPPLRRLALYLSGTALTIMGLILVGNLVNIAGASCGARYSTLVLRSPSWRNVVFLTSLGAFLLLIAESFHSVGEDRGAAGQSCYGTELIS